MLPSSIGASAGVDNVAVSAAALSATAVSVVASGSADALSTVSTTSVTAGVSTVSDTPVEFDVDSVTLSSELGAVSKAVGVVSATGAGSTVSTGCSETSVIIASTGVATSSA